MPVVEKGKKMAKELAIPDSGKQNQLTGFYDHGGDRYRICIRSVFLCSRQRAWPHRTSCAALVGRRAVSQLTPSVEIQQGVAKCDFS